MDPIVIPALVSSVWTVLQPYLALIGTKGVEEIGKRTTNEIWDAVKKKFDRKEHTQKILVDLLKDPENKAVQGAFQYALQGFLEEDQSFALDLDKLLKAAGQSYSARLDGDGAIAQGDGAVAVGKGGVHIGGNIQGNSIVTGNNNRLPGGSTTDAPRPKKGK